MLEVMAFVRLELRYFQMLEFTVRDSHSFVQIAPRSYERGSEHRSVHRTCGSVEVAVLRFCCDLALPRAMLQSLVQMGCDIFLQAQACAGNSIDERFHHAQIVRNDMQGFDRILFHLITVCGCLLYTSPSPRDYAASRMPSSA